MQGGGYPMGPMGQVQGASMMPQGLPGMQQMPMGYDEESSSFMPYMPQQMGAPMGGGMMGPMGSPSAVAGVQDDGGFPSGQMPMGGMPQGMGPYPGMMGPDDCYPVSPVMPGPGFGNPGFGGPGGFGNPGMVSPAGYGNPGGGYGNPYGQMPQVQGAMMEESPGMQGMPMYGMPMQGMPMQQGGCGCGGPQLTGQYGPSPGMMHGMQGMPHGQGMMSPYGPGMMHQGAGNPGMYGQGAFGMPRFEDDFED